MCDGASCAMFIFVNWFVCLHMCLEAQQRLNKGGVLSVSVTECCGISQSEKSLLVFTEDRLCVCARVCVHARVCMCVCMRLSRVPQL